jgi:hypothetical protein
MKWITRTIFLALFLSCQKAEDRTLTVAAGRQEKPKVTFVELGSVNCIPCRMMQPVMKAIEGKNTANRYASSSTTSGRKSTKRMAGNMQSGSSPLRCFSTKTEMSSSGTRGFSRGRN